jgi:hypothetical protein
MSTSEASVMTLEDMKGQSSSLTACTPEGIAREAGVRAAALPFRPEGMAAAAHIIGSPA